MISNEISLSHEKKKASFSQPTLLSVIKNFNDHVKLRFLKQSAEYPGSTLTRLEIESLLIRKK
jgi:hypothetical protein